MGDVRPASQTLVQRQPYRDTNYRLCWESISLRSTTWVDFLLERLSSLPGYCEEIADYQEPLAQLRGRARRDKAVPSC